MIAKLVRGDCRNVMIGQKFDLIIADPPYGDASLIWDRRVAGWEEIAQNCLLPTGSMWLFGSMRSLMTAWGRLEASGWRYAQDIVWEKHNGSAFHADRFKRVHEHVLQLYRDDAKWSEVYNDVQTTPDAVRKTVNRQKRRPSHLGQIESAAYASEDGGPRLMRSVLQVRSCHGRAIHPTEKPVALLEILIRTSCPAAGLVGDFFAGSAAVADACSLTGRDYFGAEIDEAYHAGAVARLRNSLFAPALTPS